MKSNNILTIVLGVATVLSLGIALFLFSANLQLSAQVKDLTAKIASGAGTNFSFSGLQADADVPKLAPGQSIDLKSIPAGERTAYLIRTYGMPKHPGQ